MKANKYLDQQAEDLAQRHQIRLNAMRKKALQPQRQTVWWLNPIAMMAVPAATVALLIVSVWSPDTLKQAEPIPLAQTAEKIPAWVADTQVPVEVLENIKFYEWLSHELNKRQS